jgi:hypothetical protein
MRRDLGGESGRIILAMTWLDAYIKIHRESGTRLPRDNSPDTRKGLNKKILLFHEIVSLSS